MPGPIVQVGAEAEYNAEMGIEGGWFPLDLLSRAARGPRQARWRRHGLTSHLARLHVSAGTAAERLGISFRPVGFWHSLNPVVQLPRRRAFSAGRGEAVAEGTYTLAVSEMTPTRNAVYGVLLD